MTSVSYMPHFIRQFKKLPEGLKNDVERAIEAFQKSPQDRSLGLHKLGGKLRGFWSFSVNYRYRIVCEQDAKDAWALLAIGDHTVYQ